MNPAQRVGADAELAGIVGHHHSAIEQPVPADGAPHRPLRGDLHRIGCHLQRRDAKRLEMRRPGLPVGEAALGVRGQPVDDRAGQMVPAHVGQRRLVDHVVGMTGAQAVEEVRARLRQAGAEGGEPAVADLRGHAVAPGVAGARVVDADPGRARETGTQDLPVLGRECVEPTGEQPHHLPLRDDHADAVEQVGQPLAGHLALDVAGQDEPAHAGPNPPTIPTGSGAVIVRPVRCQPALPAVADQSRGISEQILARVSS